MGPVPRTAEQPADRATSLHTDARHGALHRPLLAPRRAPCWLGVQDSGDPGRQEVAAPRPLRWQRDSGAGVLGLSCGGGLWTATSTPGAPGTPCSRPLPGAGERGERGERGQQGQRGRCSPWRSRLPAERFWRNYLLKQQGAAGPGARGHVLPLCPELGAQLPRRMSEKLWSRSGKKSACARPESGVKAKGRPPTLPPSSLLEAAGRRRRGPQKGQGTPTLQSLGAHLSHLPG